MKIEIIEEIMSLKEPLKIILLLQKWFYVVICTIQ